VEGQIYGGDLNLGAINAGGPRINIVNGTPAYTGVTSLRSGELDLMEKGRLANSSQVEIEHNARLAVDMLPSDGAVSDRIADNIPIKLAGGELSVFPTAWGMNTTERVGTVVLERGNNLVRGTHYYSNALQSHADLKVGTLVREPGAILNLYYRQRIDTPFTYDQQYPGNDLVLENPPPVVNGLLPVWINADGNFMTLGPGGRVIPVDGPTVPFETANETSMVEPSGPTTLDRDRTINAFRAVSLTSVDLGGHTLTVGSGGLIGPFMSNGVLVPGDHANGELIFMGGATISATIADAGAPTSVIYEGLVKVSGANTYTGKTYVSNAVPTTYTEIAKGAALPSGGDVEISGWGRLLLADQSGFHFKLGNVTLRDGGTLETQCCGTNTDFLSAKQIEIDSGGLSVPLEGNTPIVKMTDGIGTIYGLPVSNQFAGPVDVYDGLLVAGGESNYGYLALGHGAATVHPNGRLVLSPSSSAVGTLPLTVNIAGGSLYGGSVPQDYQLNLLGTINVTESSKLYLFDGTASDLRQTDFRLSGSINVAAGKTLELLGRADAFLGPELIISDGGINLAPGATLAGNGAIRGTISIANGAILSPGAPSVGTPVGALAMNRPVLLGELTSTMIWGQGGKYHWEINDAAGDAGAAAGKGWDLMILRGSLVISATADSPFVIELAGLQADGSLGPVQNLAPGEFRWEFVEADSITGFDSSKFVIDASNLSAGLSIARNKITSTVPQLLTTSTAHYWLTQEGNSLYINAEFVPEPATGFLFVLGSGAVAKLSRRREPSRTTRCCWIF
jgi:hypothetical protein